MDWPTLEVVLFCWMHSLDVMRRWVPLFTEEHECGYVLFVNSNWHSKRSNDGMISIFMLSSCILWTMRYLRLNVVYLCTCSL